MLINLYKNDIHRCALCLHQLHCPMCTCAAVVVHSIWELGVAPAYLLLDGGHVAYSVILTVTVMHAILCLMVSACRAVASVAYSVILTVTVMHAILWLMVSTFRAVVSVAYSVIIAVTVLHPHCDCDARHTLLDGKKSSMARSLPVENLLPQNVGSIINYLQ